MKKFLSRSSLVLSAALLVATSSSSLYSVFAEDTSSSTEESVESTVETEAQTDEAMDHSMMEHDDEGRLPANFKLDRKSTYKAGDKVLVNADHMPGMSGAEGVVVAAFDTVAYEVSYTPTDGGEAVSNHKWVVHEEIAGTDSRDEADTALEVGYEVTLEAYHMAGMEGATATIDSVNETTVYLIDYVDTESSELVINHKWVTEDELAALESNAETNEEEAVISSDSETSSESEGFSKEGSDSSESEETSSEEDSSEEGSESDSTSEPAESESASEGTDE